MSAPDRCHPDQPRPSVAIEADDGIEPDDIEPDIPPEREATPGSVPWEGSHGTERIEAVFDRCRVEDRAALVIYLPAGFPDDDTARACMAAAADAGADIIEVGFPFSDPVMDGPIIQAANQQVLANGATVADHLAMMTRLSDEIAAPLVVMTYVTIADAHGYERFADEVAAAGAAGVILPDLPVTEAPPWQAQAEAAGLASVQLASSVSSDERLAAIGATSTGWVYAVGLLGVTGVKAVARDASRELVARLRAVTDLPVAVGIGVKDAADAAAVAAFSDGVIVGSEAVRRITDGDPAGAPERVAALVADLRRGVARG